MNNFLITSQGRTGTRFLSWVMNFSKLWRVRHQPDDRDYIESGIITTEREIYNMEIPEWQQRRFYKSGYGEVNGLLKYSFFNLKVIQKGIIYRDYKDVILSFSNGKQEEKTTERLIKRIKDVNLCHNVFYNILEKHSKIVLIDFSKMTSSISYLTKVLRRFGIQDVEAGEKVPRRKINSNKKWNYNTYEDFPIKAKELILELDWKDYKNLKNEV